MGNRGFVELHNPTGFYLVGLGFVLVMLIVAAGGIFARMVEREQIEKRRQMREAQMSEMPEAVVDTSRVEPDADPETELETESEPEADLEAHKEHAPEREPGTDHPHEPA